MTLENSYQTSEVKGLSLWQVLERDAKLYPHKEAIVFEEQRIIFAELIKNVEHCAAGLLRHGIQKGDRIAVILPNWPEFVVAYFAAARLGAVIVPLSTRYRHNEVEYMLRNCGAKALIVCAEFISFDYIAMINEVRPNTPDLQHVIVVGQASGGPGLISWETLLGDGVNHPIPAPANLDPAQDLFTILYTSGTMGVPKGVMLTHQNIVQNALALSESLECTPDDVLLAAVPFSHVFGLSAVIAFAATSGMTMVLMDIYKPEAALELVQNERVTVKHGVPTMFILELNNPNFNRYDLSSLRTGIIAAAPAPVEIVRRIREDMGCNIAIAYGLTETSPSITVTRFSDSDEIRAVTVGRAMEGVEIKVVDENGEALPTGEVGELLTRSQYVMRGYYNMPEATAAAINFDGWFATGDLATIDADGYVRIVGRKKEMINRGGLKIYPREVEELYYTHPKIQEVAVIGLPDPVLGEKSCVNILLKNGETATDTEMREYVRGKLADYKIPDFVRFVDAFPMTNSGKIRKVELREEILRTL